MSVYDRVIKANWITLQQAELSAVIAAQSGANDHKKLQLCRLPSTKSQRARDTSDLLMQCKCSVLVRSQYDLFVLSSQGRDIIEYVPPRRAERSPGLASSTCTSSSCFRNGRHRSWTDLDHRNLATDSRALEVGNTKRIQVALSDQELTVEERKLLSIACRDIIDA